jgi:anti-anti-sigma factor
MSAGSGTPGGRLSLTTSPDGDAVRVAAAGEIDLATADRFEQALIAALSPAPAALLVDLAEVTFMDSTGLAALIAAHRHAADEGSRLSVVRYRPMVRRVLEITGLLKTLTGTDGTA